MWASGAREDSLHFLMKFTSNLSQDLQPEAIDQASLPVAKQKYEDLSKLLARCCFKQGQWQVEMHDDWHQVRPSLSIYLFCVDLTAYRDL